MPRNGPSLKADLIDAMKRQTFLRSLFAAPLAWLLPKPAEGAWVVHHVANYTDGSARMHMDAYADEPTLRVLHGLVHERGQSDAAFVWGPGKMIRIKSVDGVHCPGCHYFRDSCMCRRADEWLHVTPGDPLLYDGTEWKIVPPPESGTWCRTYVTKDCVIRRREFKWSDGCMNVESPIYEKDWTGEWTRPEYQTCETGDGFSMNEAFDKPEN